MLPHRWTRCGFSWSAVFSVSSTPRVGTRSLPILAPVLHRQEPRCAPVVRQCAPVCASEHPSQTVLNGLERRIDSRRVASEVPAHRPVLAPRAECPRQESNLCTRFRKPLLYPLSYGGLTACTLVRSPAGAPAPGGAPRSPEAAGRVVRSFYCWLLCAW
jgi:hypothetical protein